MSIKIMTTVWEHAPVEGGDLLVLLALADWAGEDGCSWWPVKRLAERARLSERQVSRALTRLVDAGWLEVPPGPRSERKPYRIRLNVDTTPVSDPSDVHVRSDQTPASDPDQTPTSDPYVEPSVKPPGTTKNHQSARSDEIREVWDHYLVVFPQHGRQVLDPKRRKIIDDALNVRTVAECKLAIQGLAQDEWCMGANPSGKRYDGIRYALAGIGRESADERIDRMISNIAPVEVAPTDPKIQRRLEDLRAFISSGGFFEPARAAQARADLEAAGFAIVELDGPPWVQLERGDVSRKTAPAVHPAPVSL